MAAVAAAIGAAMSLSPAQAEASPGTEPVCGSSVASFSPTTADEKVLVAYFAAINDNDYAAAWNLLGGAMRSEYGSRPHFADSMASHVNCVRVLTVTSYAEHSYRLEFAAQYSAPFPAGSGELPTFWDVTGGVITAAGTGP